MNRTLSSKESQLILNLEWHKRKFITVDDIVDILKCRESYARKIAHILTKKKWLERIGRGKYLLISAERGINPVVPEMNPYMIVKSLSEPYYFSYRVSSFQYGLITQVPNVIHVVLLRQRPSTKWKNVEFHFVSVSRHKFFGWQKIKLFGEEVNMADMEKTVLDCLDREDLSGGIEEVTRVIFYASRQLNWKKLMDYAILMNSGTICRRLGFLLNLLKIPMPKKFERFLSRYVKKDKAFLASPKRWGKKGEWNMKWNLIKNVSEKELYSEIRIE